MELNEAIAVFDKSAERTKPNTQTEAWQVIRAALAAPVSAGDGECPCCPVEIRHLYAVAHNYTVDPRPEQFLELRLAVARVQPLMDRHFADPAHWNPQPAALASGPSAVDGLRAEVERLNAIINTPHADDFLRAVSIEAEHQRQRWGTSHDSGKTAPDWFWLIGYLAGKALHCVMYGMDEKAEHHVITTAAACANWHRAMKGQTDMRPGIDGEAALAAAPAAQDQGEGNGND